MTYIIAEPCIDIKIAPAWKSAQRVWVPIIRSGTVSQLRVC